jgi:hypothetical protein
MDEYTACIVEELREEMQEERKPTARFVTCSFQGMKAVLDELASVQSKLDAIRLACGAAVTSPVGAGLYASGYRDSAARILNLMDPIP